MDKQSGPRDAQWTEEERKGFACYNLPPMSIPRIPTIFGRARGGGKTKAIEEATQDAIKNGTGCYRMFIDESGDLASEKIELIG